MQKPVLMGIKGLEQLRSVTGSNVGHTKTVSAVNTRLSSDSVSTGAFSNLKLTAGSVFSGSCIVFLLSRLNFDRLF